MGIATRMIESNFRSRGALEHKDSRDGDLRCRRAHGRESRTCANPILVDYPQATKPTLRGS